MRLVHKPSDRGIPSVEKLFQSGAIDLFINTSDEDFYEHIPDDYIMRRLAIDCNIQLITNLQLAKAFTKALVKLRRAGDLRVEPWSHYAI